jgi:hypothetical protein
VTPSTDGGERLAAATAAALGVAGGVFGCSHAGLLLGDLEGNLQQYRSTYGLAAGQLAAESCVSRILDDHMSAERWYV